MSGPFNKSFTPLDCTVPPRHKFIREYTDEELNGAVEEAVAKVPLFWVILRGVDAYMERRRRARVRARERRFETALAMVDEDDWNDRKWGDS